jgi:hypothetical protein
MIVYDMTPRWIVVGLLALSPALVTPAVLAQQSPAPAAKQAPPPDDLEPGVNTSSMPSGGASSASVSSSAPATSAPSPPAGESPVSAPKDSNSKSAKHTTNPPPPAAATNSAPTKGSGKAEDHLQLDTTQITGNQELPKVLYIVPWKKSDLGDLLGKPANSLLDEVLQPVDRDVFKRQNRYYDALKPDGADKGAGVGAGGGTSSQGSGDKR